MREETNKIMQEEVKERSINKEENAERKDQATKELEEIFRQREEESTVLLKQQESNRKRKKEQKQEDEIILEAEENRNKITIQYLLS